MAKFRSSVELGVWNAAMAAMDAGDPNENVWGIQQGIHKISIAEKCCFAKSWISPEVGMRAGTIIGCHRCDVLLFIPTSTVLNIFVSAPSSALLVTPEVLFLFCPPVIKYGKGKWIIFE